MTLVTDDGRARAVAVAAALRRAARQSRAPVGFVSGGGGFRARRGDRLFWRGMIAGFVALIVAPIVGASLYFGLIASDQYVTQTQFSLRSGESSVLDSLSGVAGLAASQQNLDSQIIVNYIPSRGMVDKLDQELDLRRIYSRDDVDWFSRFNPTRSVEYLEKYWDSRVNASIDVQSSVINVSVRAFTAQDSLALANAIVQNCESLVNNMMARVRESTLNVSKAELDRAETTLVKATDDLRDAQNKQGVIDPEIAAKAIQKIIEPMQLQLAKLLQQSAVVTRSMSPESPQVRILNTQIENIKAQIVKLQSSIANSQRTSEPTLADRLGNLSQQQVNLKVAQQQYATAALHYETARADAETQHAFLINIIRPVLAQKALYPRRWWGWSLIVFPSLLLWSIAAGLAVLVRDNMAG